MIVTMFHKNHYSKYCHSNNKNIWWIISLVLAVCWAVSKLFPLTATRCNVEDGATCTIHLNCTKKLSVWILEVWFASIADIWIVDIPVLRATAVILSSLPPCSQQVKNYWQHNSDKSTTLTISYTYIVMIIYWNLKLNLTINYCWWTYFTALMLPYLCYCYHQNFLQFDCHLHLG